MEINKMYNDIELYCMGMTDCGVMDRGLRIYEKDGILYKFREVDSYVMVLKRIED